MIPDKGAFVIEKSKKSIVFAAVLTLGKSNILIDHFSETIDIKNKWEDDTMQSCIRRKFFEIDLIFR